MTAKLPFADDLSLPMDVVTQKLAFMGRTGSGKTYAATKLAEQLLRGGAQVVVLDPVGVWWGLRLEANGKTPSDIELPIFGGLHGDIPLEAGGGKLMADLIVDRALSCVLDVSQFESDTDKARFAKDFADRFFFRKKGAPSAVMLFVEEAQEFVPQNPQKEETRMLHSFQRAIKLGRNFGIGVALVSQRPQDINKKALNQTELLFAFQLTGPQERKAIAGWVEEKGGDLDLVDILPKLAIGQPHAWSPQWLGISKTIKVLKKTTFDASSTPTFGAKAVESKPLGTIELAELRDRLAATIEKAKADDPKLLKVEIARLKKELEAKPKSNGHVTSKPIIDLAAVDRAVLQALRAQRKKLSPPLERLQRLVTPLFTLPDAIGDLARILNEDSGPVALATPPRAAAPAVAPPPRRASVPAPTPVEVGDVTISSTQQRMLDAIAQFHALGLETPSRAAVAGFCAVSHTTGTFSNNLSNLRRGGLIQDASNGGVSLTAAGFQVARVPESPPSLSELHQTWYQKLSTTQAKMLEQIVQAYPDPIARTVIAEALAVQSDTGTFSNNLSKLRTLGLIADHSRSEVIGTEILFPEGLA